MIAACRALPLALVLAAFAALPGCAGHKELKAPCSRQSANFLSSDAYAGDGLPSCGPMVRQSNVVANDDRSVTTLGDRGGITMF
ncbi:hypothetical protein BMW22_35940 (plasmid) [Rhizobium leguminosarum]|uniref:Lipoprotein n=1 Tax=Rhizobium leguminosarum TaxID=384 RepID=A0A1L3ZMG2_RHILE|nr:hypothetical protein BMW22_35940 [Rhizobium leguminosarum]